MERRLADEPKTLEELSQVYGVSRERIRQIEVRAFEKLQAALLRLAGERRLLPGRLALLVRDLWAPPGSASPLPVSLPAGPARCRPSRHCPPPMLRGRPSARATPVVLSFAV